MLLILIIGQCMTILPVIMAGAQEADCGLSRELYPKQFLKLDNDLTMLQSTVSRLSGLDCSSPLVICNEEHRFPSCRAAAFLGKAIQ